MTGCTTYANKRDITYKLISLLDEPLYMDFNPYSLNYDTFYTETRFKSRQIFGIKYSPKEVDMYLLNKLNRLFIYHEDGSSDEWHILGNRILYIGNLKQYKDEVMVEYDITPIGLLCLSKKIWKKEWGIPVISNFSRRAKEFFYGLEEEISGIH